MYTPSDVPLVEASNHNIVRNIRRSNWTSEYRSAEDHGGEIIGVSEQIDLRYYVAEEVIALCGACYLLNYLYRSRNAGYFIPLSISSIYPSQTLG